MRILMLLLCLCLAPPLFGQSVDQPSGSIGVEADARGDAAIAVRIREILSELDGYGDVTVKVSAGIVTLQGTTLDTASAQRLNELVARVEGVVAIENEVYETTDVVERLAPTMERFKDRFLQIAAFLPLALISLIVFGLIVTLGFFIARLRQPWDRIAPNLFIADIYRMVIRLAFIIGGIVIALDIVGASALLSTILGAAGIVGLAIGFAVRDTVENFIASVMLSIRQPFRPNDSVVIDGESGKVIRLTSRATILMGWDGTHIRIPNATVFKSKILNKSRNPSVRFDFTLPIDQDANLGLARSLALEVMAERDFILKDPAPTVFVDEILENTATLQCMGWVDQRETSAVLAKGETMRLIKAALEQAGVDLPGQALKVSFSGQPEPEPTSRPKPTPESEDMVDVEAEDTALLDTLIEEEREAHSDDDLLYKNMPEE